MNVKAVLLSSLLLSVPFLGASAMALEPGDQAPEIAASKWLAGSPAKLGDLKGKPCLIDFWASWTKDASDSLRLLAQLQRDFAKSGLVAIGVSSPDDKDAAAVAAKLLKDSACSLAVDDKDATESQYLSSEPVLPVFFLVGADGKIVWKGGASEIPFILKRHLDGKFSSEDAKKVQALRKDVSAALAAKSVAKALESSDALLEILPADVETVKLRLAMYESQGNRAESFDFLSKLIEKAPESSYLHFEKLALMLHSDPKASSEDLAKFGAEMSARFNDDAETLNNMAWTLLDEAEFGDAPLAVALKASTRSVEILSAPGSDQELKAASLDTLARLFHSVGRVDKAVELQAQACEIAKDGDDAQRFNKVLDYYKAALELGKAQKP